MSTSKISDDVAPDEEARREAVLLYEEGAEAWRRGERGRAMSLYARSAALSPDGPGAHALEMANEIMSFFDTNQLNP